MLLYFLIGAVVCGVNYFILQDRECRRDFDELDCTVGSIGFGVFWPFCIGVVAARVYQYIQKYK